MRKSIKMIMTLLTAFTVTAVSFQSTVFSADKDTAVSAVQEIQEGVFSGGAHYSFNTDSGILIIDGEGSFSADEFDALTKTCFPNTVVFGSGVCVPKNEDLPDSWMMGLLGNISPSALYMYKDSDAWIKYQEILNFVTLKSVSNGKMLARGVSAEGLPVYTLDEDCDPYEKFSYSSDLLERGREMTEYLMENGIEKGRAAKITSFYLMGLKYRIELERAHADGTEMNAATLDSYRGECLRCAECEQDLANTDEEFTNFTNPTSKFLSENGITGDKNREMTQAYVTGIKLTLAQSDTYVEEEPTEPINENADIDEVIRQRSELMREQVVSGSLRSGRPEYIDEVLPYYEKGLRLRIQEGLASPNGEEANKRTRIAHERYCGYAYSKLYQLAERGITENERELYTKQLEYYNNLLSSDYTLDTEDSERKYITNDGHFVKYTEFTENDGLIHEDVGYHYDPETKGIYLDGDGTFGEGDAADLEHGFDIKFFILGKNLKLGSTLKLTADYYPDYSLWLKGKISDKKHDIYFYQDSHTEKLYDLYIKRCLDEDFSSTQLPYPCTSIKQLRSYFAVTRLNDNIDPYSVLRGTSGITPTPKYSAKAVKENTVAKAKPTLIGDADLNGEVSLSDIITVSKCVISDTVYPLINLTAEANADMNGNGSVDCIDLSILIEVNLGIK